MKETRKLEIVKQKKIRVQSGFPQESSGYNGEIQIRNTTNGVRLYAKINNKWYYSSMVSD